MREEKKKTGNAGEDLAASVLIKKGYEIIERNYHYGHGEIDIIAKFKETIVFVEVKTRKNLEFGSPELAVTKSKQKQIRRIAEAYLYEKNIADTLCRIDVIAVLFQRGENPKINHIENAF